MKIKNNVADIIQKPEKHYNRQENMKLSPSPTEEIEQFERKIEE